MPLHQQKIQFCTAVDGTRIAVASSGSGFPLVRAAHWFSHVELDAKSKVYAHWLQEISRNHTYVRYDERGCGLSDRHPSSISFEAWVSDLETVVDALGLERFALLGTSQGGSVAIAYAARHPERVSHLVLLGAYARGRLHRELISKHREEASALVDIVRVGWSRSSPAFRQVYTSMLIPDGTREQHEALNELARLSTSPEISVSIRKILYQIDVMASARSLSVPTLVLHAREDGFVDFDQGIHLATLIPTSQFTPLESRNHVLLSNEPAWPHFLAELRRFIGQPNARQVAQNNLLKSAGLTPSEQEVLILVASGYDNHTIASALGKSEKTVRNQVSSIFCKLDVRTRAEAIVLARDSGVIGRPVRDAGPKRFSDILAAVPPRGTTAS
jgi:pimeloyl-ACP methyl ester carboxylesterase/DNA-binding CsgD family transcriptional regulator